MSKSTLVIETQDFKDIMDTLRMNEMYTEARALEQALTTQPLDELKDEIINELNELWVLIKWKYRENSFILEDERHIYASFSYTNFKESSITYDFRFHKTVIKLPLKLAHKITTYFMRLENSNE